MTKDEALTMCLEYIETNKHERKYVRHAIKAALEQQAEPCVGKDPRCPCQDGDACHYKDCGNTKAWPVPQAESVGEVVEVNNDGFRCEFSQHLAVGTKLYTVPPAQPQVQEPVEGAQILSKQVRPAEFSRITQGKETVTGIPAYWAEWPSKE
jgi:hypothetical protein